MNTWSRTVGLECVAAHRIPGTLPGRATDCWAPSSCPRSPTGLPRSSSHPSLLSSSPVLQNVKQFIALFISYCKLPRVLLLYRWEGAHMKMEEEKEKGKKNRWQREELCHLKDRTNRKSINWPLNLWSVAHSQLGMQNMIACRARTIGTHW